MTKRKNPEERSATSMPQPGQAPGKPTGNEVFGGTQKAVAGGPARLPESAEEMPVTEEQAEEFEMLLATATEYYDRLMESAGRLSERASHALDGGRRLIRDNPGSTFVGAFVVGVVVGMIRNRR